MGEVVPNAETVRRIDMGHHFLGWIIPRLAGDSDEVKTTLTMLFAHFEERYAEGIHDASWVVQLLASKKPTSRDLAVVARALAEMERRHRSNPVTDFP